MSDLINALIQVKEPITLLAFIALIALFAFRTKKVPELAFSLLKDRLSHETFSRLLHRGMSLGFASFLSVCGLAGFGQVLDYRTRVQPIDAERLEAELQQHTNASAIDKAAAVRSYRAGLKLVEQGEFRSAIESIQSSLDRVPSLAAQYMLSYLYRQEGDDVRANQFAEAAKHTAVERGDALDRARVARLTDPSEQAEQADDTPITGEAGSMVNVSANLPEGGADFANAAKISPGTYAAPALPQNQHRYFRLQLKQGQTLLIKLRTPNVPYPYAGAAVYDSDGGRLGATAIIGDPSKKDSLLYIATYSGAHFISVGNSNNANAAQTVYSISVK